MPRTWRPLVGILVLAHTHASAGEIPGLPAALPPYIEQGLGLTFSNDFLGSGGSVDDFRTQQIVVTARPAPRWSLLLDHSILTLGDLASPDRLDQLSGSLGYDVINRDDPGRNVRLSVGAGFRGAGEYGGERIQNGFHRLVGSDVEYLRYTGVDRTDATLWFDAEYYRVFRESGGAGMLNDWRLGSWWRASSLATSDGQWDGSAAGYLVANRRSVDLWLGLRRDWRSGYDDRVLRETAMAEDDLAAVFGVRFGPLVIETVQQFNNDASYGQLRLVSSGEQRRRPGDRQSRYSIETGLIIPDVHFHVAGRARTSFLSTPGSAWRESAFVSVDYGEPQHPDSNEVFVRSLQLGIGMEWEHSLPGRFAWLGAYASAGAGWREETLLGDGSLTGENSSSVGRVVLLGGAGVRADASRLGSGGDFRIQLGVSGWAPISDAELSIGTRVMPVQKPALNLMLGMSFDFG